jgi:hypothetical protein
MKQFVSFTLAGLSCCALLVIPAAAANKRVTATTETPNNSATQNIWPAESISGTIIAVDPNQKRIVIEGPDNVPFDMVVTPRTQIRSGSQTLKLEGLSQYENRNASIHFIPERRGDIAESIRISG